MDFTLKELLEEQAGVKDMVTRRTPKRKTRPIPPHERMGEAARNRRLFSFKGPIFKGPIFPMCCHASAIPSAGIGPKGLWQPAAQLKETGEAAINLAASPVIRLRSPICCSRFVPADEFG